MAAADSATTVSHPRCWRRTAGTIGSSTAITTRGCFAEALCKLEGLSYAPSETIWWQHGHSTEQDFIYVTTQNLSVEQLQALSEEVGEERSLLVLCGAWHGVSAATAAGRWPNLTLEEDTKSGAFTLRMGGMTTISERAGTCRWRAPHLTLPEGRGDS